MTAFTIIAVCLTAFALAWILPPLLRRSPVRTDVARSNLNVGLLREQLAEVEADLASGTLSAEKYAQAKEELERRVIEETAVADDAAAPRRAGGHWSAITLAVVVPMAAILLYFQLGNPEALVLTGSGSASGREHQVTAQQLDALAAQLAARLEQKPDDAQGWALLARSYYQLQRMPEAVKAYEKAAALAPGDAGLYADYADALAIAQGRRLEGKPLELIKHALEIDPTQWKALALAGTAAYDRKDYHEAVRYWEQLQAALPPESEMAQSISSSIAEARNLGGMKASAPAKVAENAPAAKGAPAAAKTGASVEGTVTLSPAVAAKTNPSDRVFVFARAAQGPKMPLAILTTQVKDLPFKFKLDDTMAMQAGMGLSNFPEIVVGARVAKGGNATPQSGDLEGLSKPVKVGASGLAVVIDTVLP